MSAMSTRAKSSRSARSVIPTDHEIFLDRVLPHVETGVINEARLAIADEWDGSDDENDNRQVERFELEKPGFDRRFSSHTTSTDAFTRADSPSELGYNTGRNGGLSAPRRPPAFANFDSEFAEMRSEGSTAVEDEGVAKPQNGGGSISGRPSTADATLLTEGASEGPRKTGSRASQMTPSSVSASMASPKAPRAREDVGEGYGPAEVPARQSSRVDGRHSNEQSNGSGNGNGNGYGNGSNAVEFGPLLGRARGGPPIVEEEDDQTEPDDFDLDDGYDHDHGQFERRENHRHLPRRLSGTPRDRSPAPRDTESSTPPPISQARPGRRLINDDFGEDDDGMFDDIDPGYESHESRIRSKGPMPPRSYDQGRGPPRASQNKDRRLNSMKSERQRSNSIEQRGANSRTHALMANYREMRTPMLNHMQMYQDAETRKPLIDRSAMAEDRLAPRQQAPHQKQYRSIDDGMNAGYMGSPRNMSLRRTLSDDEMSVRPSMSARTAGSVSGTVGSMPDFFSTAIFQVVLHNPTTAHRLLKFSESRLCAENVEFLSKVDEYRNTLNNLASQMANIHKSFISPGSASQINVNSSLLRRAHKDMKGLINGAFPVMETVFADLQDHIETVVYQDIYPSFVRQQVALSASRALGSDRFRYQGLGDCFCLTNPNVADNPIVFASDGFVKVTGYTRPEIIPRNCRFLQGAVTDRRPIQRLKVAIEERKESVELLLNYKKNGDPFWNLLYCAPLFNSKGKTEFFIGGQVNCSTTIHSNVDVMKVLSISSAEPEQENESLKTAAPVQPIRPSARKTFLKSLGLMRGEGHLPPLPANMDAGMEENVLDRMEGRDLSTQMKEFYTAYSRYIVVRANTFVIEFYSEGMVESLNPATTAGIMIVGSDVFRFLGHHMISKQTEYRTRVKTAIRSGVPVSTALRLQTRRSAMFRGDEAFVAHWTPLKDEKAAVHYIVVTLAPAA